MTWLHVVLAAAVVLAVRPQWVWFPYDLISVWVEHRHTCVRCWEARQVSPGSDNQGDAGTGTHPPGSLAGPSRQIRGPLTQKGR